MNTEGVIAVAIVMVCVLAFVAAMILEGTASTRKRRRRALAVQRNEVAARLRKRQQRRAPGKGSTSPSLPAKPTTTGAGSAAFPLPTAQPTARPTQPPPSSAPRIVTRTGPISNSALVDPFAMYGECAFTQREDSELIRLYLAGRPIASIAVAMQLDTKQIASRLIRLLLSARGQLDTDENAPRARRKYAHWEYERMRSAYAAGVSLERLAAELGRSPLGVGWRMLDLHIPTVPDEVRRQLQL